MKRRNFILESGSTVLTGLGAGKLARPAIGIDFEISEPSGQDPSTVDSITISFKKLELTPQYVDESETMTVQAKLELAGETETSEIQVSVRNGETKNLSDDMSSLVVDGIHTSNSLNGDITVSVDHPSVQDSYSRNFYISEPDIPDSDIENWESGTLDNWSNVESYFEVKTSPVYEGTYSGGKGAGTSGPQFPPMYYTGSTQKPEAGYKWSYWDYFGGNSNGATWVSFCGQSTNFDDRYEVELHIEDNDFHLYKYSNNSVQIEDKVNPSVSSHNWYKIIVSHYTDGTITAIVEDSGGTQLGSVTISDTAYTSGELGYRSNGDKYIDLMTYEGTLD
jgi:hypothetical protein